MLLQVVAQNVQLNQAAKHTSATALTVSRHGTCYCRFTTDTDHNIHLVHVGFRLKEGHMTPSYCNDERKAAHVFTPEAQLGVQRSL